MAITPYAVALENVMASGIPYAGARSIAAETQVLLGPFRSVLSASTDPLPTSPSIGDSYIVVSGIYATQIALYDSNGSWHYSVPSPGDIVYVQDVAAYYSYLSGAWTTANSIPHIPTVTGLRLIWPGHTVAYTTVWLDGTSSLEDGGQRMFSWNSSSTALDDGVQIIKPTANSGAGRWIGATGSAAALTPSFAPAAAAFSATQVMLLATGSAIPPSFFSFIPTVSVPVAACKIAATYWLIYTPVINGATGDRAEYIVYDGGPAIGLTHALQLNGHSALVDGTRQVFYDASVDGNSTYEFAFNVGLTTNSFPSTYGFYGFGHDNLTYTGASIVMDGGANQVAAAVGTTLYGSLLVIDQTFNTQLPSNPATQFGTVDVAQEFDNLGCLVLHNHTIVVANAGNQNSYSAMMPTTGLDLGRFGSGTPFAINLKDNSQVNGDKNVIVEAWNSKFPIVRSRRFLPTGNPGTPDLWGQDLTTTVFMTNGSNGQNKWYTNFRSGNSAVAATDSSSQFRIQAVKGYVS